MTAGADLSLAGRVALLQGATGALGGELARHLRSLGARIGVAVRRERQVAQITEALGEEGVLCGVVQAGDGESAAGFVKGVEDSLGPIDAMVSTAGTFRSGPASREPSGRPDELLEANFLAPLILARAVLSPMLRRRTGSIVFTGAAAVGGPGGAETASYLAAKSALHEYARALLDEVGPAGVRVAVVTPGVLDTEANREAMPGADRSTWQPLEAAVATLLRCAFGEPSGPGPLYPVRH